MAFKASSIILLDAYTSIKRNAADTRRHAQALSTNSAAGDIAANVLVSFWHFLNEKKAEITSLASTPGLAAYAQVQEDDENYNVVQEYTAMVGQIDATIAWLVANFPKDGSGYLLREKVEQDGTISQRSFTPAQTSSLRQQLSLLAATID